MKEVEQKLREAARDWRRGMLAVGEILNEIEKAGEPTRIYREAILRDEFGMSMAESCVAMRWAAGEFGKEAAILVAKVPASKLAKWDSETAQRIARGKSTIWSRHEKRVVTKDFAKMDRQEVADNATNSGLSPMEATDMVYRSCIAASVQCEDGSVYVLSKGAVPVRMRLTAKVLREIAESQLVET